MSSKGMIGILLLVQFLIVALGLVLMGERFMELSILNAPVINLLLWTGLTSLAGLALSTAKRPVHQWICLALLVIALVWFPASLLIFGNARFSGTTAFLWQAWLIGTSLLVLGCLVSLAASAVASLFGRCRKP